MLGDDSGVYGSGERQIYLHTLGSMANKKIYIVHSMEYVFDGNIYKKLRTHRTEAELKPPTLGMYSKHANH